MHMVAGSGTADEGKGKCGKFFLGLIQERKRRAGLGEIGGARPCPATAPQEGLKEGVGGMDMSNAHNETGRQKAPKKKALQAS